ACSALAAGAALGTKYVAILFVPWLVAVAVVLAWRSLPRWRHLMIFAVCLLLPCAYWYLRNFAWTGNPLYPLNVDLFGIPILRGWYTRETMYTSEYHIPVSNVTALAQILLRAADPILLPAWLSGVAGAAA